MDGQLQHNSIRRNNINTMLMPPRDIDRITVESYDSTEVAYLGGTGTIGPCPLWQKNIIFTIGKKGKHGMAPHLREHQRPATIPPKYTTVLQ